METSVLLSFFFSELIAGVLVYIYWRRRRSGFSLAKAEFAKTVKEQYIHGTLEQYIESVASGKQQSISSKESGFLKYFWVALTGLAGFLIVYCIKRYTEIGVLLRTVIGIFVMLPFIALLAIGIAEENDENKISNYEKATAKRLLEKIKEGTVEEHLNEIEIG